MPPDDASPSNPDDRAMVRLARGDDAALNELMDRWAVRLVAFLTRLTGDPHVAQDLAQETFVRLYRTRDRFRPGGTFKALVFQIAANLARNHARWRSRHPEAALHDEPVPGATVPEASSPSELARMRETENAVKNAVLALPPDLREPLVLRVFEGLPQKEIADALSCTVKSVEARIYRARKILREALRTHLTDET